MNNSDIVHGELEQRLADLQHGDHVCLIYGNRVEQMRVVVSFVRCGLAAGDRCVYIADDQTVEEVLAALDESGVDTQRERERGALQLITRRDICLRSGQFDAHELIGFLQQATEQAIADGFSGFRILGEMTWALGLEIGFDRLMQYEALLNDFFRNRPALALCQYSRQRFAPAIIDDALRTHPLVIVGDQVCPNLYYERPSLVLEKSDDSQRLRWKLSQLQRTEREITERRRAEGALRESEEFKKRMIESSQDCIKVLDLEGRLLSMSAGGRRLLELDEVTPMLNQPWFGWWKDKDQPAAKAAVSEAASGGTGRFEGYLPTPSGKPKWWDVVITPIRGMDGRPERLLAISRDATDRKRVEEELRRSAVEWEQTFDTWTDHVCILDMSGKIIRANKTMRERFEPDHGDLIGLDYRLIYCGTTTPDPQPPCAAVLAGESLIACETQLPTMEGWQLVSGFPLLDAEGEQWGAVSIVRDITDRKRAEEVLVERNRLMALRADVSSTLAVGQTMPSALQHCCDSLVRHLDVAFARIWVLNEKDDVLELQASAGMYTHLDGTHSRIKQGEFKIGRIAQNQQPHMTNDVLHDPEVSDRDWARREGMIAFAGYPLLVEGRAVGVVAMFARKPLSDAVLADLGPLAETIALYINRKQAEEQLREETRISETLHRIGRLLSGELDLDKLVQAVTDEATRLTDAEFGAFFYNVLNERGESYLLYALSGVPKEAFEGFPMPRNTAIFGPTFRGEAPVRLDDVIQDPRYGKNAPYHGMPAGHLPVRSYLAVPVISHSGEVLGGLFFGHSQVGIFKDRHESLAVGVAAQAAVAIDNARLYQQAREQTQKLQEADQRKDEFLAMLAHELRNPLAPIRTGLDLLVMEGNGKHRETIKLMQEQVEHVVRLVDDLLDVSRIMRGKVELRKEPVLLSSLVKRSVDAVRPLVDGHGQELAVSVPQQPIWLNADPVRLVQILENLLSNASKYTDTSGQIELTAECQDRQAVISVRDTGIGIEPELLPNIFELFTQSSRSLDRAQGGLGIGLTLVQRLVELHGGRVSAHSEGPGHGSTFTVRLPVTEAAPQRGASDTQEQPRISENCRVFVVDDNIGAARMLARLLTKLGDYDVETIHDGRSALERIKEVHPEIVLLDIGLPGMNGYEVGKILREMPEFDDLLLVALTGYGQQEDRQKSKVAGFDEHLVKPLSVDQLKAVLAHPKLKASRGRGDVAAPAARGTKPSQVGADWSMNGDKQSKGDVPSDSPELNLSQMKHDLSNTAYVLKLTGQLLSEAAGDSDLLQQARTTLEQEVNTINQLVKTIQDVIDREKTRL